MIKNKKTWLVAGGTAAAFALTPIAAMAGGFGDNGIERQLPDQGIVVAAVTADPTSGSSADPTTRTPSADPTTGKPSAEPTRGAVASPVSTVTPNSPNTVNTPRTAVSPVSARTPVSPQSPVTPKSPVSPRSPVSAN